MYIKLTMKDVETIANKVETGGAAHGARSSAGEEVSALERETC